MPSTKTKITGAGTDEEQAAEPEPAATQPTDYEPINTDDVFDPTNVMEVSSCGNVTTIRTTFKHVPSTIDHYMKKGWTFLGVSESPLRHAVLIFKSK